MMDSARQRGAIVALLVGLGMIASLLGSAVAARFTSSAGEEHGPAAVVSAVTNAVSSVPMAPRPLVTQVRQVPQGARPTGQVAGIVGAPALLLIALLALLLIAPPGGRGWAMKAVSSLPRRAPPNIAVAL
jgi:hypothetical protein